VALRGLKVLVIDPLPLDRKLFRLLLGSEGCVVETAPDCVAASALLRHFRARLIVIDTHIPGDDTLGFVRALKAAPSTRHIGILAVSAYNGRRAALAAGCDAYIGKPIVLDAFLAASRQLLALYK
jgi:CheY-like chemotaxis protein